jgi:hypothetical protein
VVVVAQDHQLRVVMVVRVVVLEKVALLAEVLKVVKVLQVEPITAAAVEQGRLEPMDLVKALMDVLARAVTDHLLTHHGVLRQQLART